MLVYGEGISMNKSLAAHYFKMTVDQGVAIAQHNYAILLRMGEAIIQQTNYWQHIIINGQQIKDLVRLNSIMLIAADGISILTSHLLHIISNYQQIKEMLMFNVIMEICLCMVNVFQ
jgi:hypothetical protein